ncbi:MAG: hypothetical protein AAFX65_11730 [Cyanobacteria bacterium J06638_7]
MADPSLLANVLTSAHQWLLQKRPAPVPRSKEAIDTELATERDW